MRLTIFLPFVFLLLLSACDKEVVTLYPEDTDSTYIKEVLETKERFNQRTKGGHDAKYGVFIHGNPSSVAGVEISGGRDCVTADSVRRSSDECKNCLPAAEYDSLYKQFNPIAFDAEAGVKTFIELGFKYVVGIVKHHDGFSMFDDPYNNYKICSDSCPVKYDITKQIVDACHKYDLPIGFYYSLLDGYHPDYGNVNHQRFLEYQHKQVQYLLSNYGKIDIIGWDAGSMAEVGNGQTLYEKCVALQPNIMFNNRLGRYKMDFNTLEGYGASTINNNSLWERCHGATDGFSYGPDNITQSTEAMFATGFNTGGLGGNFLLGIGPRPDGSLDPEQMKSVTNIANWLKSYGECVYETFGGPYYNFNYGGATCKGNTIYLIVDNTIYKSNILTLPKLPASVQNVTLITNGDVAFEETSDSYKFTANNIGSDNYTVIKMTIDKEAIALLPVNGGGK